MKKINAQYELIARWERPSTDGSIETHFTSEGIFTTESKAKSAAKKMISQYGYNGELFPCVIRGVCVETFTKKK